MEKDVAEPLTDNNASAEVVVEAAMKTTTRVARVVHLTHPQKQLSDLCQAVGVPLPADTVV